MPLAAVTFDFWNTLFVPAGGHEARLEGLRRLLAELRPDLPEATAESLLAEAAQRNDEAWRRGEQFGGTGVVRHILAAVGIELTVPAAERFVELVADPPGEPPQPIEGVAEALLDLRRRGLRLGVVSDTGYRPGRVLRRLLDGHGLLDLFAADALAFSDEVGVPKPNPVIFQKALAGLGAEPEATVHVGDLRFTDIAGARRLGMATVRFTAVNDDQDPGPEADAVVSTYAELAPAIANLR